LLKNRARLKNPDPNQNSSAQGAARSPCIRATVGASSSRRLLRVSADCCADEDDRKFENRRVQIEDGRLTTAFSAFPVRRLWKIRCPQNADSMAAAIADSEVPAQSGRRGSTARTIVVRSAAGSAAADFFQLHQSFGIDRTRANR
jgi:hypothetical protein